MASGERAAFECDGSATNDGWAIWLVVLGGIGSLTGLIVSLAIGGDRAGPWWAYAIGLVGVIGLAVWSMQSSAVKIRLERGEPNRRLVVSGRGASLDVLLRRDHTRWQFAERIRVQHGGGVMMHFAVVVETRDGRKIGFRQMGGEKGEGWPAGEGPLEDGRDVFVVVDIFGLERWLRGEEA